MIYEKFDNVIFKCVHNEENNEKQYKFRFGDVPSVLQKRDSENVISRKFPFVKSYKDEF